MSKQIHETSGSAALKKHKMSTFSVFLLIFCLVAGGYFGIEDMVSASGPGLSILLLIVFPFFWSIPQALFACELGSALPDEGGYYVWVKRAFGEFWGFQVGWWRTISCYVDSAVYVVLAVGYIDTFIALPDWQSSILKVIVIVFFTYINYRGIEEVGKITSALMIFVLGTLVVFVIFGIINWNYNPVTPFIPEGQTLSQSLGLGIAICIWIYSGYESMGTMSGELENPQVITKATLLTIPAVILVYIIPIIFGMGSYNSYQTWAAEGGTSFVTIAASFGGPILGFIMLMGAAACNLSLYNSYLASSSRGFFVLAEDKLAPPILCKVNKKHGTPHIAIFSMAVLNLVFAQFGFETLVVIDVILFMFAYAIWFLAGITLRIKEPDLPRPFKIWGGVKTLIAITVVPIIICFVTLFTNGSSYLIGGSIGLLTGPLAYLLFKRMYGGTNGVKKLKKSDRISCGFLAVVVVVCIGIGFAMYRAQASAAKEYFSAVTPSLENDYDCTEQQYNIGEDSYYVELSGIQDKSVSAVLWYYEESTWGEMWIDEDFESSAAFAEHIFPVLQRFYDESGELLLDSLSISNTAYEFYLEQGEQYQSIEEIKSYFEEEIE